MRLPELERMFEDAVRTVWGDQTWNFVGRHITYEVTTPKGGTYAAVVVYGGMPRAIGRTLIRRAQSYTVQLSDRLLALDDEKAVRGILLHEAIHIGVTNHGTEFRSIAREVGAPISEYGITSKPRAEVKDGARYKSVKEFDDFDAAMAWAKRESRDPASPYYKQKMRVTGAAERLVDELLRLRASLSA